jgi:hypothetical protein
MFVGYGQVFFKATRRTSYQFEQIERDHDVKMARDKATRTAYESSEDYYSKKLCEIHDRIELAAKVIKREKEASAISGVEDQRKLHDAGTVIQSNTERMDHFTGEFKTKFNKSWDVAVCGN